MTSRIRLASPEEWEPIQNERAIVVLDLTVGETAERFGWVWESNVEDGLGVVHMTGLLWDGRSRYVLEAFAEYPANGIGVSVDWDEDVVRARADLLAALQLPQSAVLAVVENDQWYSRWDSQKAWERAPSAPRRWFEL